MTVETTFEQIWCYQCDSQYRHRMHCVCKSGMFCVTFVIAQSAENDLNIMPQMGLFFKNGNFKNMVRTELS